MSRQDHSKQEDFKLPAELQLFEDRLRQLELSPDRLDREELLFLAGRAAAEQVCTLQTAGPWRAAFAAMTAITASLLVMLLTGSSNVPVVTEQQNTAIVFKQARQHRAATQNTKVFTSSPSQLTLLEAMLAEDSFDALGSEPVPTEDASTTDWPQARPLTPASIRKLLDESSASFSPRQTPVTLEMKV